MWEFEAVKALKLSPLIKDRFKKAVRKLQFDVIPSARVGSSSNVFGQIHRVVCVITSKEQESINKIESQRDAVDAALKSIELKHVERVKMQKASKSEIDSFFESVKKQLDERHQKLKEEFQEKVDAQSLALLQLRGHQESIGETLNKLNAMVLDPKIESKKRENDIVEITAKLMGSMDLEAMTRNLEQIVFSGDEEAVSQFIS